MKLKDKLVKKYSGLDISTKLVILMSVLVIILVLLSFGISHNLLGFFAEQFKLSGLCVLTVFFVFTIFLLFFGNYLL